LFVVPYWSLKRQKDLVHDIPIFQKASFMEEMWVKLISRYWTGVEKVFERDIPKGCSLLGRD